MFTGLIQKLAVLKKLEVPALEIELASPFEEPLQLGESLALNGACLTLIKAETKTRLQFEVSPETIDKTDFLFLKEGSLLNVERAMKVGERLGGHWVQGHVDELGEILKLEKHKNFWELLIQIPKSGSKYIVEKGSISVDGISLTVNALSIENGISFMIIPHTWEHTNLKTKKVGDSVHLEYDILAKYIFKQSERLEKTA